MYLCSYVEAAFGETGQDVDPEDSDFQVPYLFFRGAMFGSLGPTFWWSFPRFFRIFARFWVLFLVPFLVPKTGLQNRALIGFLL